MSFSRLEGKSVPFYPLSAPKILSGLEPVIHLYDGFVLDIWGVLHNGLEPFSGVVPCLEKLRALGKKILLLSNAARRTTLVAAHLEKLGISSSLYDYLLTSGEATYLDLAKQRRHLKKCYFMGQDVHRGLLGDLSLEVVQDLAEADFILNTGPDLYVASLREYESFFEEAIQRDIVMICSNPDLSVMVGNQSVLCAGSLAQVYEQKGGRVRYHGKPYPFVYDLAFSMLQIDNPSRILALGDSLRTDILGARQKGIDSALVFSGLHGSELGLSFGMPPLPQDITVLTQKYAVQADYYLSHLHY